METVLIKPIPKKRVSLRKVSAVMIVKLALMLAFLTSTALAQTAHSNKEQKTTPEEAQQVTAQGQQTAIDAKTGKLRQPTQQESQALSQELMRLLGRDPEKLNAIISPTGAVMIELTDDYHDVSVVKINPDGTLSMDCITGLKVASQVVEAGVKSAQTGNVSNTKPQDVSKTVQSTKKTSIVWEEK